MIANIALFIGFVAFIATLGLIGYFAIKITPKA